MLFGEFNWSKEKHILNMSSNHHKYNIPALYERLYRVPETQLMRNYMQQTNKQTNKAKKICLTQRTKKQMMLKDRWWPSGREGMGSVGRGGKSPSDPHNKHVFLHILCLGFICFVDCLCSCLVLFISSSWV